MSANPNIVWIDPDVCEKCMICVEVFGCPAIQRGAQLAPLAGSGPVGEQSSPGRAHETSREGLGLAQPSARPSEAERSSEQQFGIVPWIHAELCNGNGSCIQVCPVGAIKRPSAARFGGAGVTPVEDTGQRPAPPSEGYKGGPTQGSKTEFAGPGSEQCK